MIPLHRKSMDKLTEVYILHQFENLVYLTGNVHIYIYTFKFVYC